MKSKKYTIALLSLISLSGFVFAAQSAPVAPQQATEAANGELVKTENGEYVYNTKKGKIAVKVFSTATGVKLGVKFFPLAGTSSTIADNMSDIEHAVKASLKNSNVAASAVANVLSSLKSAIASADNSAAADFSLDFNVDTSKPDNPVVDIKASNAGKQIVSGKVSVRNNADGSQQVQGTINNAAVDATVANNGNVTTVSGTVAGKQVKDTSSSAPTTEIALVNASVTTTNNNGSTSQTTVVNNPDGTNTTTVVDKDPAGNVVSESAKTTDGNVANASEVTVAGSNAAPSVAEDRAPASAQVPASGTNAADSSNVDSASDSSSSTLPDNSQVDPVTGESL
ncbi:MAG: hypothetical protein SPI34_07985 [Opitutales bacterium]|nr:hypothetical protein [Opitutales bacterium]